LTLVRVGLYPPIGQHETQEFPPLNPECPFLGVELHISPPKGFEYLLEVLYMLVERVGLHDDVFHVHFHTSDDEPLKDFVHEALVGYPDVLEAEWHDLIVVIDIGRHEGRLLLVLGVHTYLVIARISVQEA